MIGNNGYFKTVLESGLEVHSLRIEGARQNYFELLVKSGCGVEPLERTGVAHYLEHMFSYGSPEVSKEDFLPRFRDVGGNYNFSTSMDRTNFFAFAKPEKVRMYMEAIASVISNPIFTPNHVEEEREAIITEELQRRYDEEHNFFFSGFRRLFENQRSSTPVIGNPEHIEKISFKNLKDFHQSHYILGNMAIVVTGNVDHDDLVRQAEVLFSSLPKGSVPSAKIEPVLGTHTVDIDLPQNKFCIGFSIDRGKVWSQEDDYSYAVAGILVRRLNNLLREDKGLLYGIGTGVVVREKTIELNIEMDVSPDNRTEVLEYLISELENVCYNLEQSDISCYKNSVEETLLARIGNVREIGESIIGSIMRREFYQTIDEEIEKLNTLTPEKLKSYLVKILKGGVYVLQAGPAHDGREVTDYIADLKAKLPVEETPKPPIIGQEFNAV